MSKKTNEELFEEIKDLIKTKGTSFQNIETNALTYHYPINGNLSASIKETPEDEYRYANTELVMHGELYARFGHTNSTTFEHLTIHKDLAEVTNALNIKLEKDDIFDEFSKIYDEALKRSKNTKTITKPKNVPEEQMVEYITNKVIMYQIDTLLERYEHEGTTDSYLTNLIDAIIDTQPGDYKNNIQAEVLNSLHEKSLELDKKLGE